MRTLMQMQEVMFESWMEEGWWPAPELDIINGSECRLRAPCIDFCGAAEHWLVANVRRAFGLPSQPMSEAYGSKLADWICRRRPPFIKPSVLLARRKVRGIRTPEEMNAACHELAELAWMAPVTKVVDYRATFMVNPRLLEMLSGSS